MIIYIHGFSSHGYGGKARALREYYANKDEVFMAPSLSYVPELAIQTLEELISVCDDVKLIGSSLGGYYTMYLAEKYDLKAVLINPAMYPYKTLSRMLGQAPNFYDGSFFEWKESHLEMLKKYETNITDQSRVMLMVQKGDDVLDYREAVDKLPNATQVVEEGGDHSFVGVERYFDDITLFLSDS
jgi:predicted esterase YcpF (UPF0227 family)